MSNWMIRHFKREDMEPMAAFARILPEHDLLFLGRDLKHRRVVEAWVEAVEDGFIDSILAESSEGEILATAALVRDPLGWSPHVGEIRLLVHPERRGEGLGRALLQEIFRIALTRECKKLVAQMTPDQTGAIALFEEMGFRGEAMLRDHVQGRNGNLHDLAILSQDVDRMAATLDAFGLQKD